MNIVIVSRQAMFFIYLFKNLLEYAKKDTKAVLTSIGLGTVGGFLAQPVLSRLLCTATFGAFDLGVNTVAGSYYSRSMESCVSTATDSDYRLPLAMIGAMAGLGFWAKNTRKANEHPSIEAPAST